MKVLKVCKVSARLLVQCSAPTSGASTPMSKRKSADANDMGVDDPKQVRLRAYPVSMFGAKKNASMLRGIRRGLVRIFCQV